MLELSPEQNYVLSTFTSWLLDKQRKQFITLGGYAGTGKSTLIAILRGQLESDLEIRKALNPNLDGKPTNPAKPSERRLLKVAFCSFTGKAARVLKSKLLEAKSLYPQDSVGTIHSLIYAPVVNEVTGEIIDWKRKNSLQADLIILDEASMVDKRIWADLLEYGLPILAVGDHGQLPPISGEFNLLARPQLRLEKIYRQAEANPIVEVAQLARTTGEIPAQKFGPGVVKYTRKDEDGQSTLTEILENYTPETLVLCGYNTTRIKLNQYIRSTQGFDSPLPQAGDRVICLRNNHKKKIFNGMLGRLRTIQEDDDTWYYAEVEFDDELEIYKGLIAKAQFNSTGLVSADGQRQAGGLFRGDLFDFGYALTVHKAQGSQARRVVLFAERFKQQTEEMWRRWLYTGVTRAEEELYIFGD